MRSLVPTLLALGAVAACMNPDDPGPATEDTSADLLGGACPLSGPNARLTCQPGQCGRVPDGCRGDLWCGDCACPASSMSCERSLTWASEITLVTPGWHTLEIINPTSNADPVLHVLDANGTEVAYDDNGAGGVRPRLTVQVPTGTTRIVVVRAKSDAAAGSATLLDGTTAYSVSIGGIHQTFTGLRAGEDLETVKLPGGASGVHTIYAMSGDGEHIVARAQGNGTLDAAVLHLTSAAASQTFVLSAITSGPAPTQLIRNDAALHDRDLDGLGDELEAAIGTCSAADQVVTGKDGVAFDCHRATDVRDTDGDGLSDLLEVRGDRAGYPHSALPLWGASPRHKDLFAEVDSAQRMTNEIVDKMTIESARRFSDIYGDRVSMLTPALAAAHADELVNPDHQPGIRTHLDIGRSPTDPADATVFGDWGGYSTVPPPMPNTNPPVTVPLDVAWPANMATTRRGVFRYAMSWNGGGGSTGVRSYAWGAGNQGSPGNASAHESGHANGLPHSGPGPVDPNGVDPNCKVAYPSIMNYAYTYSDKVGFSDGQGLRSLDNAGVVEWNAVSPEYTGMLRFLDEVFEYRVDYTQGHVDWNRDGVFAPPGQAVRAYTNSHPGGECEFTRYNANLLDEEMRVYKSPALGRLGSRLYVFAPGTNMLRYQSSLDGADCPQPSTTPCRSWIPPRKLSTFDVTGGVDAARVRVNGSDVLLIVGVAADGTVNYSIMRDSKLGPLFSTPAWVPILARSSGEPALETMPDGRALLVIRERDDHMLVWAIFDPAANGWVRWAPAADCTTGNALYHSNFASPGLVRTNFVGNGPQIYGLFSNLADGNSDFRVNLRRFDASKACWTDAPELPVQNPSSFQIAGRPAAVFVPDNNIAQGGRLYVVSLASHYLADQRQLRQRWSYVDKNGTWWLGADESLDNEWLKGYGVDAWFDPGIDKNLRVAFAQSAGTAPAEDGGRVRFLPKADGINAYAQENRDDWAMIRIAMCRMLTSQNASQAISCPAWPY